MYFSSPDYSPQLQMCTASCLLNVSTGMTVKYLKFNTSKIEFMLFPPKSASHTCFTLISFLISDVCSFQLLRLETLASFLTVLFLHIYSIRKFLALPFKRIQNSTSFHHLRSHRHLLLGNCGSLLRDFSTSALFFTLF